MKVTLYDQLHVRTSNEMGAGARIFTTLLELGINIIAFNGWEMHGDAHFLIILEDQVEKAQGMLETLGFLVEQKTAIAVELSNRPGSLVALLRTLAEANIDVIYSYATGTSHERTKVVLETSDNEMAKHLISTIPGKA
jgi:hypothetical protein